MVTEPEDDEGLFRNALARLIRSEAKGIAIDKDLSEPDVKTVLSALTNPEIDNTKAAQMCLDALKFLKSGTRIYDAAWNAFDEHLTVLQNEQLPILDLLQKAVTLSHGLNGKGIEGKAKSDTVTYASKLTDAQLAMLNPSDTLRIAGDLAAWVKAAYKSETINDTEKQETEEQIKRLIKAADAAGQNDSMSVNRRLSNSEQYLNQLHGYFQDAKTQAVAMVSLMTTLTDPVSSRASSQALWSTFNTYISGLSDPAAENAKQNIEGANFCIKKVWDALQVRIEYGAAYSEEDRAHENMLQTLAARNHYNLETGKTVTPPSKPMNEKLDGHPAPEVNSTVEKMRFEVSHVESNGAPLIVPHGNVRDQTKIQFS